MVDQFSKWIAAIPVHEAAPAEAAAEAFYRQIVWKSVLGQTRRVWPRTRYVWPFDDRYAEYYGGWAFKRCAMGM